MKINVIGAGAIGGNLAAKLSTAGHDVQVADARGPEAVRAEVLSPGLARWTLPTPSRAGMSSSCRSRSAWQAS
ncbi:NAD(P)-binding domain-containing protein [Streptomyces sp. NPDC058307]|uniref:NAD(P)-binding domain-containing protein n=1 Tax=Streptomyces sp. NPDC058307 TaxID=3346439 RepID=UPI0036EC122E